MSNVARSPINPLPPELRLIAEARHHDPFAVLGRHPHGNGERVQVYLPGARSARLADTDAPLRRVADSDVFRWDGPAGTLPAHCAATWPTSSASGPVRFARAS